METRKVRVKSLADLERIANRFKPLDMQYDVVTKVMVLTVAVR